MEESAQVLEIETFIPMQLQEPQDGRARLKRVVLIGDHNQVVDHTKLRSKCALPLQSALM